MNQEDKWVTEEPSHQIDEDQNDESRVLLGKNEKKLQDKVADIPPSRLTTSLPYPQQFKKHNLDR